MLDQPSRYIKLMRISRYIFIGVTLSVSGCDWVDSTGNQSSVVPDIEVLFNDGSPFTVAEISEGEDILITSSSSDRDGVITTWRWSDVPTRQGILESCTELASFDVTLAATSLAQACESEGCSVSFEQREVLANDGESVTVTGALDSSSTSTVQFVATMPRLSSPVALTYELVASNSTGGRAVTEHTFCIDSVNDAPVAVNDVYTVTESGFLQPILSERSLLQNDTDDNDVRNRPLEVLPTTIEGPFMAENFELFSDGSFAYSFGGNSLANNTEDRFVYEITDGTFSAQASVIVRVVAVDDAPELISAFPPLVGIVGIDINDDFNQNILDPEGATLSFTVDADTLPPSGEITVSSTGVLSGAPAPSDIGSYSIAVQASDGTATVDFVVPLTIIGNARIESRSIPNQEVIVGDRISLLAGDFFTDPESQTISFQLEIGDSDVVDLTISDGRGLLTGFVNESGVYEITVVASDGVSLPTRETFELIALSDNEAPEFEGPNISSQTITRNQIMIPIRANFSDADGDTLTYTLQGVLPLGVSLSNTGVISGRPTVAGTFAGIRIVATDPEDEFARTNSFNLIVR